jgi:hypothetical protein
VNSGSGSMGEAAGNAPQTDLVSQGSETLNDFWTALDFLLEQHGTRSALHTCDRPGTPTQTR